MSADRETATWRKEPPTVEEAKAHPFGWFNRNDRWKRYNADGIFRFDLGTSQGDDGVERYWFDEFPSEAWAEIGGEWSPCEPPREAAGLVKTARNDDSDWMDKPCRRCRAQLMVLWRWCPDCGTQIPVEEREAALRALLPKDTK